MNEHKQYDLQRFIDVQKRSYDIALAEIKAGKKLSHWIWYIFPQLRGLGYSHNSNYYGIENKFEAFDYLSHPVLGSRLREITMALLTHAHKKSVIDIFGSIDAIKVKSSMTLFSKLYFEDKELFKSVLDKFYRGEQDKKTLNLLYPESEIHAIYLSKDNYLQHIPISDIVAIKYAVSGAMGSAGQVIMVTLSGELYVLETAYTNMSCEECIKSCPILEDYWSQNILPDEWDNRYYMGMGNHLFINKSIVNAFDSRIKRFRLEHMDLYANWIMVVLDSLGKWK